MGMHSTHRTAESCYCLDVQWLKKHGYFYGFKAGGITWTSGGSDNKSSIGFFVDTTSNSPNIRFTYSTKSWGDDVKKDMDYSFPLVKVPCNLGGFRWAFKCNLNKNGVYCGRIVYKLYQGNSDYFGCRKCMDIVYKSQRECRSRFEFFGKMLDKDEKYEEIYKSIHKWCYQGKPTRKVRRLERLKSKMLPVAVSLEIKKKFFGNL